MVIKSHEISTVNNFIAAVSNWLFLAGFIVISGAFTSISHTALLNDSQTGRVVQYALRGTPLLVLGSIFCFAGGIGMAWVYWQVKHNYSWLVDRVFLQGGDQRNINQEAVNQVEVNQLNPTQRSLFLLINQLNIITILSTMERSLTCYWLDASTRRMRNASDAIRSSIDSVTLVSASV
ncbi:hypothetical protein AUP68_10472 [Ilyonectria robusta]